MTPLNLPSFAPVFFPKVEVLPAEFPDTKYVSSTSTTNETRDGSFHFPFLLPQDAVDAIGVPTTAAEFENDKTIEVLDGAVYTGDIVIPTLQFIIDFGEATLDGDITVQIDNAERQGSTQFPNYTFKGDYGTIGGRVEGDILFELASGGTAVNIVQTKFLGFTQNGGITIADGTNGGASITTSLATASFSRYTMATDTFKGRETIVSMTKGVFPDVGTFECRYFSFLRDGSQILNQTIEEHGSTGLTRTFTDLTLRSAGSVTWDIKSGSRTWAVDAGTATEFINKVTSYPTATPTFIKPTAEAIEYDNTISGLTATDVQAAIDELENEIDGMMPLSGGTLTGDITGSGAPNMTEMGHGSFDDVTSEKIMNIDGQYFLAGVSVNAATYTVPTSGAHFISVEYTDTGTCTVTLPAGSSSLDGMVVIIADDDGNAGTNNITIDTADSATIDQAATFVIDTDSQTKDLRYNHNSTNWKGF